MFLREPVPLFLERPTTRLLTSYQIDDEQRQGPFIDVEETTNTSRLVLDIRTRGWAYHPALLVFSLGVKPELKRQSRDTNTEFKQDDDTDFLGFFADATLLQFKPYTINLFAQRQRTGFTSSLASDTTTESSIYRGRLLLKYDPLPTTITLERRDSKTENFYDSFDVSDTVRIESRHETSRSRTTLKAEAIAQDRGISGSEFTTDRINTSIINSYQLSEKANLATGLNFVDSSSGVRESTTLGLSTRLSIRHRSNFRSHYRLRLDKRDERDFSSNRKSASTGLSHHLYENLTTSFNVSASQDDLTGGELNTYGSVLDFRYRRRIPWGALSMNLGLRARVEDDKRDVDFSEVRDEQHSLSSTIVFFDSNDIDLNSIIVTDVSAAIIFVEGIDYIVTSVGRAAGIERTLLGGIANGQSVLVDYRFVAEPPNKTLLKTTTFGVNLNLRSVLTVFYNLSHSKEDLLSGLRTSELTDDTVQRAGTELRWKWNTTRFEVEDRDTTRTPLRRWLVREFVSFRPSRNLSLGFSADYGKMKLKDSGEVTTGTGAGATAAWQLGGTGRFRADASYRRLDGRSNDTETQRFIATYDWIFGAWRPSVRYRFVDEKNKRTGDSRQRQSIFLQLERRFR